jgi:hypothetical protein
VSELRDREVFDRDEYADRPPDQHDVDPPPAASPGWR